MHLLTTSSVGLDDIAEAVDLGQSPGDIAVLSFADSDLAGLAAAWDAERSDLPTLRLAHLRDLRHPMSVDLWIDRVGANAKVILVRLLGGLDFWRYGVERLSALARERSIALAVLPGEDREDERLAAASTLPPRELATLLEFFREGGTDNLRGLLRQLARHAGRDVPTREPAAVPRFAGYLPGEGAVALDRLVVSVGQERPVVPVVFYRALLLAGDIAPVDSLYAALAARGLSPAPLVVTSLKDRDADAFLRQALARLHPALIVTMTAFAAGSDGNDLPALDAAGVPVLQVVSATTKRAVWRDSQRGLNAADLAMHVVLPELDGRVLAGAVAFKEPLPPHEGLAFTALISRAEPDRVAMVADRIAAYVRLRALPRDKRRVAILLPDYPAAKGRSGYAVGLDVPASVVAAIEDLAAAGYAISDAPQTPRALLDALAAGAADAALTLAQYDELLARLPPAAVARLREAWGEPAADADVRDGAFHFRGKNFGNVVVALPPDRGRTVERRADYHDAVLPPRHALVAFGLWLQHGAKVDALVHMGAHGTLEWLPGKAVALTSECFPEIVTGALPVIYPFIVSNPGEAAQAKRRIAALTIGHLPPPLVDGGPSGEAHELELLLDEYAQADGLDRRRRERLAALIVDTAERTGLAQEAGIAAGAAVAADEALRRIDAWLCDLKDLAIKDGQHIYGRAPAGTDDPAWVASAAAERAALIAALDGARVAPGPAGAPARGRLDVLPTGRNLFTADPRTLPTPTAMELGRRAAEEVVRGFVQAHGDMPREVVIDLWGSATLRTGGEEIAQSLALLGCRPIWDRSSGRVTGIEVMPCAAMGRPRVDVTWRISGLFRDLFPAQIALLDAAVQAVAARDETAEENPLATARRSGNGGAPRLSRIFGTAPGVYGAGIEHLLAGDIAPDAVGTAYLAAASHAYGGADGEADAAPGVFAQRIAGADALVHVSDDPGRDLLEGAEDAAFVGGFAAAAKLLGRSADLVMLDMTDPQRPRARSLSAALARIVRARAVNPRFIAGQMRHGPRGAAELAETVDRLVAFAQTTGAVASALFDLLHDAYVADRAVRDFLLRENPEAAAAIAERFEDARRCGVWHPRRNDIDMGLMPKTGAVA
ncbi:MAG TPA: cobaltochelatase subunit CobN [Xanthobacteraceae bacterium]|jgi:cobaltochelatase CobN|nr:cobaltochelatase subunit CobN [Xanthobacteraceae bacterium]